MVVEHESFLCYACSSMTFPMSSNTGKMKVMMSVRRMVLVAGCIPFFFAVSFTQEIVRLWPGAAPGALGSADKDVPTLTVTLPDSGTASGAAIVICPGGGYGHLAPKEGEDYARFLAMHGVTGFVLKYRLGSDGYRYPAIFEDVQRALRLVRARSALWHIDPHKIGVMGSSAGGHLASTLLTHFDSGNPNSPDSIERASSRPDFGILCYPVISMGPMTHQGSIENLLGEHPPQKLVDLLSNEKHVSPDTPPCFIWQTSEDKTVSVQNSIVLAEALAKNNVPFELHIYQQGGHGLGLADKYPFVHVHPWANELVRWLKIQGAVIGQESPSIRN
jgi:acetyl esterase/lipase